MAGQRKRGFLATTEGARVLDKSRRAKNLTFEQLATLAELDATQVKRLFSPHLETAVQRNTVEKIAFVLEVEPTEFIDRDDWVPPARSTRRSSSQIIDWRKVCSAMLTRQEARRLLRQPATEKGFELDVFVGLGLVNRQQQKRSEDAATIQVMQQEEDVITRCYEHDEFLREVIRQTGKNIAIVGEPGAGKTTLLSRIAHYIQTNTQSLIIYIPLAGLQRQSLKEYILGTWLPEALAIAYPDTELAEQPIEALQKRLREGDVWLLLDAVDEMGEESPARALAKVRELSMSWNVRSVLTCRTNVWNASLNNQMQDFETYKTQEFHPEQVEMFIRDWFAQAQDSLRGESLIEALQEPQREQIALLVQNPLRLALLCQLVYRHPEAELPETKAGLYEQFVRFLYEWKPALTDINWAAQPSLQVELHNALGRLALAGLDSDYRFRLPLRLVQQELDDRLFSLAWGLGWLNLVDRDVATNDPVYSFFHPTFQEYFAALAVDSWHYFFHHVSHMPEQGVYRVTKIQWQETISLWLEQHDLKQQQECIQSLVNFEDHCLDFYSYKAFLTVEPSLICLGDCPLVENLKKRNYILANNQFTRYVKPLTRKEKEKERLEGDNLERKIKYMMEDSAQKDGIELNWDDKEFPPNKFVGVEFEQLIELFIQAVKEEELEKSLIEEETNDEVEEISYEICDEIADRCSECPDYVEILMQSIVNSQDKRVRRNFSKIVLSSNPNIQFCWDIIFKDYSEQTEKEIPFPSASCILLLDIPTLSFKDLASNHISSVNGDTYIRYDQQTNGCWYFVKKKFFTEFGYRFNGHNWFFISNEDAPSVKQITKEMFEGNFAPIVPLFQECRSEYEDWYRKYCQWESEERFKNTPADIREKPWGFLEIRNPFEREITGAHEMYKLIYGFLWSCAQSMSYPDFYHAWHGTSEAVPTTPSFAFLPETLHDALQLHPNLAKSIHLLCIDASQFSDPINPALDIYIEMLEQGCPPSADGKPKTLSELKSYWRLDLTNLPKHPIFLLYNRQNPSQPFNETFLQALSTFGGSIAAITDQATPNLQTFSPNQSALTESVLKWCDRIILEI